MRHRIKVGKVGSFTPEKQKVEVEQLEDREVIWRYRRNLRGGFGIQQ